jgi:hypothetical protein
MTFASTDGKCTAACSVEVEEQLTLLVDLAATVTMALIDIGTLTKQDPKMKRLELRVSAREAAKTCRCGLTCLRSAARLPWPARKKSVCLRVAGTPGCRAMGWLVWILLGAATNVSVLEAHELVLRMDRMQNLEPLGPINLAGLESPIILRGDDKTAYRDAAAIYHKGTFYLYVTMWRTEAEGLLYSYTAMSNSTDLRNWTEPRIITPRGQKLNYSSPGNIVRIGGEWILCLQTYPIPGLKRGERVRWADDTARLYIMRSKDLINWSTPELLRVKGPDVPVENMGRMIDPYLIEDKDAPGKWWCFYKQHGVSYSWSRDLKHWTYEGHADSGENVCVLIDGDEYVLMHSPRNGMGIKRSKDLRTWRNVGDLITLGQDEWPWAQARLTAGFVLDLREEPRVGKYLLFFHGSGPGKVRTQDNVFANCCIGIAWSDNLTDWHWPGKGSSVLGRHGKEGVNL